MTAPADSLTVRFTVGGEISRSCPLATKSASVGITLLK